MLNSIFLLKGTRLTEQSWQRVIVAITLALMPVLAPAETVTEQLLRLHNDARQQNGRAALCLNQKLLRTAESFCQYMASTGKFSHTADGRSPGQRMGDQGYDWSTFGENIAAGYPTPQQVMNGWMNSPGHRGNILNRNFVETGLAKCTSQSGTNYWVAVFAAPVDGGATNCMTGTSTGTSTSSPNGTTGNTTPYLVKIYNECPKYADAWYQDPAYTHLYHTFWNNSCYEFDRKQAIMFRLVQGAGGSVTLRKVAQY